MSSKVTESLLSEVTTNTKENEKVGENEDRDQQSDSDTSDHENDCGWTEILYGAGDAVFGSVVVAPCVVGVWRGAWGLMDRSPRAFPFAQSFLVGIVIHVCFALGRPYLLARSVGAWRRSGGAGRWLRERLLSRVYHYVFTLGCILHWRGGWGLFDMLVETALPDATDVHRVYHYVFTLGCILHWRGGWGLFDMLVETALPDATDVHRPVLIAFLVTILLLAAAALRAARNVLAAPYFVVTDGKEATYSFTTRWRKEV
ncbi:hypothetical protein JYU34_008828 [Plutella xylostella]|uniref:Uncharacterized protein n=1 Tax=Plutella xylostella TaxID=51655 RepID=A0ABQ7QMS6_PLUXY|nr:hypothetical protein JYU34_008828 [Plutella xylostella]